MKIFYKSLFRGWVEITEEQKHKLVKHMIDGITALSGTEREKYINSRFLIIAQFEPTDARDYTTEGMVQLVRENTTYFCEKCNREYRFKKDAE